MGWKHQEAVATLEARRKELSAKFYKEKKAALAQRAIAAAQVDA